MEKRSVGVSEFQKAVVPVRETERAESPKVESVPKSKEDADSKRITRS